MFVKHDGQKLVNREQIIQGLGIQKFGSPPATENVAKSPVGVPDMHQMVRVLHLIIIIIIILFRKKHMTRKKPDHENETIKKKMKNVYFQTHRSFYIIFS